MTAALLIAQWAVSLVAVAFYCLLVRQVAMEYGWWAVAFVVFPPACSSSTCPPERLRCWRPFLGFVAAYTVAMGVQRLRLGYWAWADVGRYR